MLQAGLGGLGCVPSAHPGAGERLLQRGTRGTSGIPSPGIWGLQEVGSDPGTVGAEGRDHRMGLAGGTQEMTLHIPSHPNPSHPRIRDSSVTAIPDRSFSKLSPPLTLRPPHGPQFLAGVERGALASPSPSREEGGMWESSLDPDTFPPGDFLWLSLWQELQQLRGSGR